MLLRCAPQYCHTANSHYQAGRCLQGISITDPGFSNVGAAVTGGVRYWGSEFAETKLFGSYIFAEYIKGSIHVSALLLHRALCVVHMVQEF
jgi:hypothetical protein